MPLHEQARAFLDKMASSPQPNDIPIAQFRQAAANLIATGPPLQIGKVENLDIPGGDGQSMGLRIYVPEGQGPFPVLYGYTADPLCVEHWICSMPGGVHSQKPVAASSSL